MKKIIALLMSVMMCFVFFAGCDENTSDADKQANTVTKVEGEEVDDIINKAIDAFKNVKSVHVDANTTNTISAMGTKFDTTITASTDADSENGLQYMKTVSTQLNNTTEAEIYMDTNGDQVKIYVNNNGMWTKQTMGISKDRAKELGLVNADQMNTYLEGCRKSSEVTSQNIDGTECYVFDATFSNDDFDLLEGSGFAELINPMIGSSMSAEDLADILRSIDGVKCQIVVDKNTYLPLKMDMDLSAPMTQLMKKLEEKTGQTLGISFEKLVVSGTYSKYNAIDKIVIPDAALNGQEIKMYN